MGTRAVQVFYLLGMEHLSLSPGTRGEGTVEERLEGVITLSGGLPVVLSKAKHYKHLLPTGDCLNTSKLRGISLSIDPEISRER